MSDPLDAVSPLDGRYASRTAPLRPFVSEAALLRARARVEVEYLVALSDLEAVDLELDGDDRATCRGWYERFGGDDARRIKAIEVEGDADRPATNHDVKAVEYWLRDRLRAADLERAVPWVHFGLTSEDVNNLAYRLLLVGAHADVLRPAIERVRDQLAAEARAHRDVPMPARTHGQAASPTTYGKELAVFADRLDRAIGRLDAAIDALGGKLGGATGTFAAHAVALPAVDWPAFAADFVEDLGLAYRPLTTQVNPNDDLAALFDAYAGAATVLLDLDTDMWRYVSDGYLVQAAAAGEVGSSTMPHKVNPIDFENGEGNLGHARAALRFLADDLPVSRLQRDLSDSTVSRTIGEALGRWLLGVEKTADGLDTVAPDAEAMADDLAAEPAVLAEAVQTALRRVGDEAAYERVKAATRDVDVDAATFDDLIEAVAATDPALAERLEALTPAAYTGLAAALVDELDR
ncbi:MAG: adenylosuccinate lyase [Halobacteriales archaeon]